MAELLDIAVPDLKFPEGPRWHDGALWLSDQLGGVVLRVTEDGAYDPVCRLEEPSGLGFPPEGGVLVATMSERRVVRVDGGRVEVVADLGSMAAHLNDMYVDPAGRAYVDAYEPGWSGGALVSVTPGRPPSVAAGGLSFPNGLAVTPDGATLIVAETSAHRLTAFDVGPDGGLTGRRVWAELGGELPDGLCLDAEGAVWVASYRSGAYLRVREGGEVVDRVELDGRWAMACALGGSDGRTLYLCSAETTQPDYLAGHAVGYLQRCRVEVPGVERP